VGRKVLVDSVTMWSFFLLTYTIMGLNRDLIPDYPLSLLPVVIIALATIFFQGREIEKAVGLLRPPQKLLTRLFLLGTLKYGLVLAPGKSLVQ